MELEITSFVHLRQAAASLIRPTFKAFMAISKPFFQKVCFQTETSALIKEYHAEEARA
jgi:hypothetical protein